MDMLQEQFEQGVGDRFASWLGKASGDRCVFLRRADRAPDLVYLYREHELLFEITAAYYDESHAEFLWKGARSAADVPAGWSGADPDRSLAAAISKRVTEKSKKRYGENTILLIEVPPGITSAEELEELLASQHLPPVTPFLGVFVVGTFPVTTGSAGGYRVFPLKPIV